MFEAAKAIAVKAEILDSANSIPLMSNGEYVVQDYATMGLSLKAHPVSFVRPQLEMLRILSTHAIQHDTTNGQRVKVAGLVLGEAAARNSGRRMIYNH